MTGTGGVGVDVRADNIKRMAAIRAEAKFERKAEKMLSGHRVFPNGRDYRCFVQRHITRAERESYRRNFDSIFPDAPGAGI